LAHCTALAACLCVNLALNYQSCVAYGLEARPWEHERLAFLTLSQKDDEPTIVTFSSSITNETRTEKLGKEVRTRVLLGGHLLPISLYLWLDDMGDMGGSWHRSFGRLQGLEKWAPSSVSYLGSS